MAVVAEKTAAAIVERQREGLYRWLRRRVRPRLRSGSGTGCHRWSRRRARPQLRRGSGSGGRRQRSGRILVFRRSRRYVGYGLILLGGSRGGKGFIPQHFADFRLSLSQVDHGVADDFGRQPQVGFLRHLRVKGESLILSKAGSRLSSYRAKCLRHPALPGHRKRANSGGRRCHPPRQRLSE